MNAARLLRTQARRLGGVLANGSGAAILPAAWSTCLAPAVCGLSSGTAIKSVRFRLGTRNPRNPDHTNTPSATLPSSERVGRATTEHCYASNNILPQEDTAKCSVTLGGAKWDQASYIPTGKEELSHQRQSLPSPQDYLGQCVGPLPRRIFPSKQHLACSHHHRPAAHLQPLSVATQAACCLRRQTCHDGPCQWL
jgi:hypothetical protein